MILNLLPLSIEQLSFLPVYRCLFSLQRLSYSTGQSMCCENISRKYYLCAGERTVSEKATVEGQFGYESPTLDNHKQSGKVSYRSI